MDWKAEIETAWARVKPHVRRTPVVEADGFGLGFPVALKLEQMQHTGSFKARGAFNTLLSMEVPEAGLVAASGGNHGAAVAYAAMKRGVKATIFVPEIPPAAKIEAIRRFGAEVRIGGAQ